MLAATSLAYPQERFSSKTEKKLAVKKQLNTNRFSCNLVAYNDQCRQFDILSDADSTRAELKDGCESMGGEFSEAECPSGNQLSRCASIVRNYNKPDVIYDNIYYLDAKNRWDVDTTKRVCHALGGDFFVN